MSIQPSPHRMYLRFLTCWIGHSIIQCVFGLVPLNAEDRGFAQGSPVLFGTSDFRPNIRPCEVACKVRSPNGDFAHAVSMDSKGNGVVERGLSPLTAEILICHYVSDVSMRIRTAPHRMCLGLSYLLNRTTHYTMRAGFGCVERRR